MRALLLASSCFITARIIDNWLKLGNSIAEVWSTPEEARRLNRSSSYSLYPEFSSSHLLKEAGVPIIARPPFREWPDFEMCAHATGADVLISSIFMSKIPDKLLTIFQGRAVNYHPAILPHYRGPTPTRGMLLDGKADEFGGITLHVLSKELDEGPIIAQKSVPLSASSNYFSWQYQIAIAAGELTRNALPAFLNGQLKANPQDPKAGSYRRLSEHEAKLGPHLSFSEIEHHFSSLGRYHLDYWINDNNKRIKIIGIKKILGSTNDEADKLNLFSLDVNCTDYRIRLKRVTPWFKFSRSVARARATYSAVKLIRGRL